MNISFKFKEVDISSFGLIRRPIIPITIISEGKSLDVEALIDSGSDGCVIPKDLADAIGIKTTKTSEDIGIGGEKIKASVGQITITIDDGKESITLPKVQVYVAVEGGTELEEVIIGREPIFRDFNVIFRQNSNKIILERARRA